MYILLSVNPPGGPHGEWGGRGQHKEEYWTREEEEFRIVRGILFYESSRVLWPDSAAIRRRVLNYVHGR